MRLPIAALCPSIHYGTVEADMTHKIFFNQGFADEGRLAGQLGAM